MPDELPMNDPKKIWQDQPTEPIKMSLDEIRRKAEKFQTKSRLKVLMGMVIGLFVCVAFARRALERPFQCLRMCVFVYVFDLRALGNCVVASKSVLAARRGVGDAIYYFATALTSGAVDRGT